MEIFTQSQMSLRGVGCAKKSTKLSFLIIENDVRYMCSIPHREKWVYKFGPLEGTGGYKEMSSVFADQ